MGSNGMELALFDFDHTVTTCDTYGRFLRRVATAEQADIPVMFDALGTVVQAAVATVRPQVSGVLPSGGRKGLG